LELGQQFLQLAAELTNFKALAATAGSKPSSGKARVAGAARRVPLACFQPDWKQQIARMRTRTGKKRTPPGQVRLAFKTGRGGWIDAEVIAQATCLAQRWQQPNALRVLERIRVEQILPRAGIDRLLENYRALRRLESILRRWSFEGGALLPREPEPYRRVA